MTAKPGTTSTADRILDAAIGLMNTKGYNPVSVREIAKAVGLSEMTVFRHFPSKYAMLMAAMRRAPYAEMIEDVFTTHVRWELEHDLRHFMRRYMDIAEQRIGIWRIYFSAIGQIDEHSTELVSDVTSFRERLRAYFEEMIRRGHIRQLDSLYVSSLFWNLIFGFVMTLVIGRKRRGWSGTNTSKTRCPYSSAALPRRKAKHGGKRQKARAVCVRRGFVRGDHRRHLAVVPHPLRPDHQRLPH